MEDIENRISYYAQAGASNPAFDIRNINSEISYFYQLKTPYQVTYEVCSGTDAEDYLNTVTLSGKGTYYRNPFVYETLM